MLEILTVLLVAIIGIGVIMIVFSEGEPTIALNGVMLSVFGASALLTTAKMTAAAQHRSLEWLYGPLAALPNWVLVVGVAVTAALFIMALIVVMDYLANLLCRWRGGHH